jgi:hypothetical protein
MPLSPIALKCVTCGKHAAQLRQPEIPSDLRGYLVPLVKLLSLKYGPMELPKSGNMLEVVDPATLSTFLDVKCAAHSDFPVLVDA